MSTENSDRMMNLLKELAVLKGKIPATGEEHLSYRRRRKEIRAEMKRIAAETRSATSGEHR